LEGRTSAGRTSSGGKDFRRKDFFRWEGLPKEGLLPGRTSSGRKGISVMRAILSGMLERIPPREWRDLGIAWFAITLAFTLIFLGGGASFSRFILVFALSSVTVGMGFILHELAHKFTAMHYGYWAEFRRDNLMLLVAVAMAALVGFVFAAPGATVIYGSNLSRRENGWISASGAITNLLLSLPFVALALTGGPGGSLLLSQVGTIGWKVNAMLASFNMLPVGPLDGKKVFAWNPWIFLLLIGAGFGLLALSYVAPLPFS
jgi:Zn-dependent protease